MLKNSMIWCQRVKHDFILHNQLFISCYLFILINFLKIFLFLCDYVSHPLVAQPYISNEH